MNARMQRPARRHLDAIDEKLSSIEANTKILLWLKKRTESDRTVLLRACEAAYAEVAPRFSTGRRVSAATVAQMTEAQFREAWDYEPSRMRLARLLAAAVAQARR